MSPETTLLCVNAAFLGYAYLAVYPAMAPRTLGRMAWADAAITAATLIVGGLLFAGSGTRFSLLLLEAPWWVFSLVVKAAMELPLFVWLRARHGGFDGDDG